MGCAAEAVFEAGGRDEASSLSCLYFVGECH